MGVPTIDGLGPIGGYDHSPEEYLEIASIVPRTTLLAALIAAIGRDPEVRAWRLEREAASAGLEDSRDQEARQQRRTVGGDGGLLAGGGGRTTRASSPGRPTRGRTGRRSTRVMPAARRGPRSRSSRARCGGRVHARRRRADPDVRRGSRRYRGRYRRPRRAVRGGPPAATLVVVARLMTPSLLVEVEAEARREADRRLAAMPTRSGARRPDPTPTSSPRNRFRRHARRAGTRAAPGSPHRSRSGSPSARAWTSVCEAAIEARTAGPTSRR